ncbi:MAG: aspartate aminotransferase family protein [Vallitalea sp.]|jgi:4-aminobutyrate aminotransferase|nr:aspartate aminotransferase family protein [Vallitalea sp.]
MKDFIGSDEIINKKKQYLFPCSHHFYKNPPQLVRGEMQYLYDNTGKKYIDFFAGVSVVNCGHCNPVIVDATINQLKQLQHTTTIYLTQPMVELAEKMSTILPGNLNHSFFCCSGSEANEGALLLARLYTGKKEFIALEGGLHGRTHLTMSGTGIDMWRVDPYISDSFHFIPNVHSHEHTLEKAAKLSIKALKKLLKQKAKDIAAFIVEPIQGNGGIITPPDWYFEEVKKLLTKHNVLMIVDEVQTGFARTGKMFAIEHYNVVPDIMTVAKALGNGIPIAAFCTNDTIAASFNKPSASTLGGNPVACETALAVINYIEKNNLSLRANELGKSLKAGLNNLKEKYPIIHDIRGIGLMMGAELLTKDNSPASEETDIILELLKDNGIILGKNGINRNVLAFQPPLVITQGDIDNVIDCLDNVLSKIDY